MRSLLLAAFCLACLWSVNASAAGDAEFVFRLDETSTPLAVRQEKAKGLLKAVSFEAGGLYEQFRLNSETDLSEVQQALDTLLKRSADSGESSASVSMPAQHYLTWAVSRAQMLNGLDFSEASLRYFFRINPKRYPCKRTAKVSELIVPDTYLDSLGSTAVLAKIGERLTKEEFARVSYEITSMLGNPDTGFKGEVTEKSVGAARFAIYEELWRSAERRSIEGAETAEVTGGPYKVPGGYLFVQVLGFTGEDDDCFGYYRGYVVTDYGREWLKKIYRDTLTTATRELRPQVNDFTTGTATSATAYVVGGHRVSFAEARATMPFLFGNMRTAAFWKSIQRQALEVELIYHGQAGKAARETAEYPRLVKMLAYVAQGKEKLKKILERELTTASLERWFDQNRARFIEVSTLSYDLYRCRDGAADRKLGAARCAAMMQKLRSGELTEAADKVTSECVARVKWNSQSREIQVACQDIDAGEWSEVFSIDGKPHVLFLSKINRRTSSLEDVADQARLGLELEVRRRFWRDFAGLEEDSAGRP